MNETNDRKSETHVNQEVAGSRPLAELKIDGAEGELQDAGRLEKLAHLGLELSLLGFKAICKFISAPSQ